MILPTIVTPPPPANDQSATLARTLGDVCQALQALNANQSIIAHEINVLQTRASAIEQETRAAFASLNKRISELASLASTADNNAELNALSATVAALNQAVQLQLKALDDRIAQTDRSVANFSNQERYAITRAVVARILAEDAKP